MLIPEEYKNLELVDIPNEVFRGQVANYVKTMREMFANQVGLLMWGPPSSGKSAAAAILSKEVRRHYKTTMFITIWDLRDSIFNRVMYVAGKSPMQRAKEVDFLVLDGLDVEDANQKFLNLLAIERLVNVRSQQGKLTVITSRVSPRDMKTDPNFTRFWKAIEAKLHTMHSPDPKEAIRARKAYMKKLLDGGDE
jgi:DNA replication protein DnaC